MRRLVLALAAAAALFPRPAPAQSGETLVYVGTFTGQGSQGIYAWRLDPATARMQPVGLVAEVSRPGFLALHPNGRFLYAVSDSAATPEHRIGVVRSFAVDRQTARLTQLNGVSSRGSNPAYVSVDREGRNVLVANYGGGSVAVFPVQGDGRLAEASDVLLHSGSSVHPTRQTKPFPHSIAVSPDGRFALAADLGADRVFVYRLDTERGKLLGNRFGSARMRPGAGPRHFVFHPSGRYVYVANELSSSVSAFRWNAARGELTPVHTLSSLPGDFTAQNTVSEVKVHPNGRFLYVANRGHDSIGVYAIDPATGRLSRVQHVSTRGRTPRNFGIDPSGRVLIAANQNSNSLVVFRVDPATGRLQETGQQFEVSAPTYVLFVP